MSEGVAELRDRIAALEQHISDLETSLENVRKERDEAYQKGREDERAFSKPSGQVAEDVEIIRRVLASGPQSCDWDALGRLAARAQECERHREAEDEALREMEAFGVSARRASEAIRVLGRARDAAVTANAALVKRAQDIAEDESNILEWRNAARAILGNEPHPGAALLERLKRLEEALNDATAMLGCSPYELADNKRLAEMVRAAAIGGVTSSVTLTAGSVLIVPDDVQKKTITDEGARAFVAGRESREDELRQAQHRADAAEKTLSDLADIVRAHAAKASRNAH